MAEIEDERAPARQMPINRLRRLMLHLLFGCSAAALLIIGPPGAAAVTAKDKYFAAEACFRSLEQSPKHKKYRHYWQQCIDKFQAVYRHDTDGPWAAAGLYQAGRLYLAMARYSGLKADRQEALDLFQRIVKRFPRSRYTAKARQEMKELGAPAPRRAPPARSNGSGQISPKAAYAAGESCHQKLLQNPGRQKYRDQWLKCIDAFEQVYTSDPSGPWAAAGLYMSARLYLAMYRHSYREADQRHALDTLEKIIDDYPDSAYRHKAAKMLANYRPEKTPESQNLEVETPADLITEAEKKRKDSKPAEHAGAASTGSETGKAGDTADAQQMVVNDLRFWSNPNYTRVVIDGSRETAFMHRLLREDPAINKPERLFVDLQHSRLNQDIDKVIPIHDNLLSKVRAGQHDPDTVRVVIDIKSSDRYKIFSLNNPFRIVIDVWGTEDPSSAKVRHSATASAGDAAKIPSGALAKQLALGVQRIVIDPGHGGRDYGAPGYLKGVHEKYITLAIAKRLKQVIEQDLQCEVILTRSDDRFLTLEERTAIANTRNADLFISLHANASRDRRAYGIETYFLNLAMDNESILVAARENATSAKNISDLEKILNDLMQNAKINESSRLAGYVQDALCDHLSKKYRLINNKGVKQAPFYVLLGAQMPAILVETSFISNARECKRLVDKIYQDHLCQGLLQGIQYYLKDITPTVYYPNQSALGPTG